MARRRPLLTIAAATAAVAVTVAGAGIPDGASARGHGHPAPKKPTKVVIIVVDSLSKEIVDKYSMKNVKKLMKDGVDTPRGYLGHTGSVTVVTHNVITSGQLPKHMGWTDEGYRDVAGILGDPEPANPDQLYITSNATTDLFKLQQAAGYPKLADYLGLANPAAKTFTISPKGYAGYAFGGAGSDSLITFGSSTSTSCGTTPGSWRPPSGINVPSYISGTPCSRFWVHTGYPTYAYDTAKLPAVLYPLDGDRYTTGKDAAHQGGDVWAADAAVEIMRNDPSWNGIFVTLPGVDKAAHMWGGVTDPGPTGADGDAMTHMVAATAEADRQVGKIMAELKARGELDNTLVVLTADHGSVAGKNYYGKQVATKDYGYNNWYYGDPENDGAYVLPQDALLPLVNTGNVGLSYSDSMLRVWLKDQSPAKVAQAAAAMQSMAAVTAVWRRHGDHYDRVSPVRWDRMKPGGERQWFADKAQELVDTQAAVYGPDLIATLPDDTTYSVAGDHGGIQRAAQQIPIVFAGAGLSSHDLRSEVRSVDIMPMILRAMGIAPTSPMDGIAYALPTERGHRQ
jgi:hypothetical protein